jgi:type III pantothenate kinase
MKLLVDFGNTRLKWALLESGGRLVPGGVFAHEGVGLAVALGAHWSALGSPGAVLVASVVAPSHEAEFAAFVRERFDLAVEFARSPRAALGIVNAYAEPQRLGVDRFLALAALHADRAGAQVLAGVGTALTLDALDAGGRHLGGLIAPSPTLARKAVRDATARVGGAAGALCEFAGNSADALHSGTIYGAVALIERFCASASCRLGTRVRLALTGGGVEELAALLPDAERRHDLVLRGLALWATADARP